MRKINIPVEFINDLFNRARQLINYIIEENPNVNWRNNDVTYKASADWKHEPIYYCVSGLKYEEYTKLVHKQNYYVLFGIAESFYELGFNLVYDIVDCSFPLLKLYRDGVLICVERITTWRV